MPRRYFNWKLLIVLLLACFVLVATTVGIRRLQQSRRADRALRIGTQAYEQGRWLEAASNLGRWLVIVPDDVPTLFKYAYAQLNIRPLEQSNVQQAIAAYRAVLRYQKGNTEAALKLAEIYIQMDMAPEAELIISRALAQNDSPALRRILAVACARQRRFDEAADQLESLVRKHPDEILAYDVLGQLLEQQKGLLDEGPQYWFDEAVKNNPTAAMAYITRAGFYLRAGSKSEAVSDLTRAQELDLSDPVVHLRLVQELINAEMFESADVHLTQVWKQEPQNQILWQLWASLALRSRDNAKIKSVAQNGLSQLHNQPWDFMPQAVRLYIECGEFEQARNYITQLRRKDIAPAATAFLEGLMAKKQSRGYEAVKAWYRAIQLGGESDELMLMLSSTLSELGDKQSAIRYLRKLVSKNPMSFDGHINLARELAGAGLWAQVADHADAAMQIAPKNPEATILHVQARLQLLLAGRISDSETNWEVLQQELDRLEKMTGGALQIRLLQFQAALGRSQLAKAEQILSQLKVEFPDKLEVALAQVDFLDAQDMSEQAVQASQAAVQKFPDSLVALRRHLALLVGLDKRDDCESLLKDAIQRFKQPSVRGNITVLLARLYEQWGEHDKLYELLTYGRRELPDNVPIRRCLLSCSQVKADVQQAGKIVEEIRQIEGEDGWQWRYEQARLWYAQKDFHTTYPHIVSLLKENLLVNPEDQASRMLLAASYERAGQSSLGVLTYSEALDRAPDDITVIVPAVAAMLRAHEYERADEIIRQAAACKLVHPDLTKLQLQSHFRRGELSAASDILEQMWKNEPNDWPVGLSLAMIKLRQQDFDRAQELLNELRTLEPKSLPILAVQVELYLRQNEVDKALALCDKIVNDRNSASAYILRGRMHMMLGQMDEASTDFEDAARIEPNELRVWIAKSDFHRAAGQFDLAVAAARRAVALAPDDPIVARGAILTMLASQSYQVRTEAEVLLNRALAANQQDVQLRLCQARCLLARGTAPAIRQATEVLSEITKDLPYSSQAWWLLAKTSVMQNQPVRAMDFVLRGLAHTPSDKLLLLFKAELESENSPKLASWTLGSLEQLYPDDVDVAISLAKLYGKSGQIDDAMELLERHIGRWTDTYSRTRLRIALAEILYENGQKEDALNQFSQLYQSGTGSSTVFLAEMSLLESSAEWAEVLKRTRQRLESQPQDTSTLVTLAKRLASYKNNEAMNTAETLLWMLLEKYPHSVEALGTLAVLEQVKGLYRESATLYQQVLVLEPANLVALNNLAWILCERQNEYEQALELVQRGLEMEPDYVDMIDTRGVIFHRLGQYDKAVADFKKCLELYPDGTPSAVTTYMHLGRSLAELGQSDKASEALRQALDLNTVIGGLTSEDLTDIQRLLGSLSKGV
jgi:tetratricopeptide (TPR) repeat protein